MRKAHLQRFPQVTRMASAYRSALGSTSMARDPNAYDSKSFVRGKSGHFPFAPGGLDGEAVKDTAEETERALEEIVEGLETSNSLGRGGIRTIPPGFERGLDFDSTAADDELLNSEEKVKVEPLYRPKEAASGPRNLREKSSHKGLDPEVEKLLPNHRLQMPAVTNMRRRPVISKKDWAHVVDVNNELVNFRFHSSTHECR
jgi:antiviral helicase SKI2